MLQTKVAKTGGRYLARMLSEQLLKSSLLYKSTRALIRLSTYEELMVVIQIRNLLQVQWRFSLTQYVPVLVPDSQVLFVAHLS